MDYIYDKTRRKKCNKYIAVDVKIFTNDNFSD